MQIILNGTAYQVSGQPSLAELVLKVSNRDTGIAVAVNSAVIPRGSWADTVVSEGDRVEVVTAVQGG
ncbi:MAG: sulfur carrier protein ThiS [Jatrophihabitantaceae bacterium]